MTQFDLAPGYAISRVIKGGWQLAGGHGTIDRATSVQDMFAFCEAGITTFDCADIYTGVEEMIGAFRSEYAMVKGAEALGQVKIHTKCVPDLAILGSVTRQQIEAGIDRSLKRLGTNRLDLVQYHWWDYEVDRCIQVGLWLADMQKKGKIAHLGGTNFDTDHMVALVRAGMPLVSMQVQYSLIDDRPARRMAQAGADHGVHLICYGTVSGGLMSERWLGAAEPQDPYENRSLRKYKLIVDEFGGWELFQELLRALDAVARRHKTDIASVASRIMLDRPGVAAVIVGARNADHVARNAAIATLELTAEDIAQVEAVLARASKVPGEVFALERDRNGPHGSIMKYNLNKAPA